jgi:hypothetical protein
MTDTPTQTLGQLTAPNLSIEAGNGITYAYRRFGAPASAPPLVFFQHFRGNLDNWDLRSSMHWTPHSPKVLARNGFDGMSGEEWL